MFTFNENDYTAAVSCQDFYGGWLLIDGLKFLVCTDIGTVRAMRGQNFIDQCEDQQCWDETKLIGNPNR